MALLMRRTLQFESIDEAREFAQRNNGTLRKGYQTTYAVEYTEELR